MNDITLDPDGRAVQRFIEQAVRSKLSDTPIPYAFEDGWPVELGQKEGEQVLYVLRTTTPRFDNPHGGEHKRLALREVMPKVAEGSAHR